jgi:twitching motility two-component system response regulator PilH
LEFIERVVFALVKILVIDDSSFQRKIISKILTENGYTVILSENGKDGVEQYKKEQPDLIFTDLLMPEYDGYWVLEQLNSRKNTVPVIVLTSDIQNTTEKRCRELGAVAFLNKPVDKQLMISAVQNALKRS